MPNSEENTPTGKSRTSEKKLSTFSSRKIINAESPRSNGKFSTYVEKASEAQPDHYFTPKVTRKKGNLYKLTIMQNASKVTIDAQPNTTTNVKSEEFKSDLTKKLAEAAKEKEESKSALLKQYGSFQNIVMEDKTKSEATFSAKSLVFGPKVDDKIMKKHLMLIMRGLNYSVKLLKPPPMSYIQSRQIMLKELKSKHFFEN